MLPKAELHCHVEGSVAPELALSQARKYGGDLSDFVRDGAYVWHDFTSFLAAYDAAAALFRTAADYSLMAEDYLTRAAAEGSIYVEFFTSPDHAERAGLSPMDYTLGLANGMENARAKTGIESRMIVTGVRHFGPESVVRAAEFAAARPHPLVTGYGMAGEERFGEVKDYVRAFDIARDAGLGITVHAGELAGWESVANAMDHLKPSRIGHGVRAIENSDLVKRIAAEGVVLECCPASNVALKVFNDFAVHPFPALRDAGCKVTLSSDDPPFFHSSIGHEYAMAREHFGMDDDMLLAVTRTSIEAAFVDEVTRSALLKQTERN